MKEGVKRAKVSVVVAEDEDEDEDEGPEQVSMGAERARAAARAAQEEAATQRVAALRQQRAAREAAAREAALLAAKLRRQKQTQPLNAEAESPNFLPPALLSVLGRDSPRTSRLHQKSAGPSDEQKAKAREKQKLKAKLSDIWQENGISISLNNQKSVEVQLPESLIQFMDECKEAIPRAEVQEKRKRAKKSTKAKM